MGCERPDGFILSLLRDTPRSFPTNWSGELPPKESQEQLKERFSPRLKEMGMTPEQVEEALDFFEQYKERYYEVEGGQCYHRTCGGGAMVQTGGGVFCATCGKLPDLLPPECLR